MEGRATADAGCIHINSGDGEQPVEITAFVPDQDTTIDTLTGVDKNGNEKDYRQEMNIGTKTLKQGSYFAVPIGEKITLVELGSGAIVGYK